MQNTTQQPAKMPGDILTPREVAKEWRIAERTLANWRAKGIGPKALKFGARAVRYRRADVEAFIAGGAQ
ncbi:MAG: helix-turn-helix domain-containing protein [Pseudoxanthomonas sp.]